MTIRELSEDIHISTTSILRFCKKCGVEGFSEFKTVLKSNNNLYIGLWILEKYCLNHNISDNKTKNLILTKILKNKS